MGRRPFAIAFAFFALAAVCFSPPARAADEIPPEDESGFGYASDDIALADGGLTDGYKLATGAEADSLAKSTKAGLEAFVKENGGAESLEDVLVRVVACPEGGLVTVGLIKLNQRTEALEKALLASATAKSWTVKPVGTPMNWLVASGAEAPRAKVVAAQIAYAAQMLATKSSSAIEDRNPTLAASMARIALRIDPKNARANLLVGSALHEAGAEARDQAMVDEAIARYRASLAKDATGGKLTPREATSVRATLANALLTKSGGPSAEARDLLKEAVKTLDAVPPVRGVGYLYDLACAHARLGEIDEAFAALEKSLAANKTTPNDGISHWREKDKDLDPLKGDPRWAKLLETYPATEAPTGE